MIAWPFFRPAGIVAKRKGGIDIAKKRSRGGRRGPSRYKARQYKVTCSVCGKESLVPVPPPRDTELTCVECLEDAKKTKS